MPLYSPSAAAAVSYIASDCRAGNNAGACEFWRQSSFFFYYLYTDARESVQIIACKVVFLFLDRQRRSTSGRLDLLFCFYPGTDELKDDKRKEKKSQIKSLFRSNSSSSRLEKRKLERRCGVKEFLGQQTSLPGDVRLICIILFNLRRSFRLFFVLSFILPMKDDDDKSKRAESALATNKSTPVDTEQSTTIGLSLKRVV